MKDRLSRQYGGFTLVEALVALLVLAVGVIGLVSMQLKAMQGSQASYQRSIATLAAQDMVERLWIQLGKQANETGSSKCPLASETAVGSTDTILEEWHSEWVRFLPTLVKDNAGEDGEDTVNREGGCRYTITVKWQDERFLDEDTISLVDDDASKLIYVTRVLGTESAP